MRQATLTNEYVANYNSVGESERIMNNSTNVRIPEKYEKYITDVWYEGREDGYWASLTEASICSDTDCHFVHEWTQKDFKKSLQSISVISPFWYLDEFGADCLIEYVADYLRLHKGNKNFDEIKLNLQKIVECNAKLGTDTYRVYYDTIKELSKKIVKLVKEGE